MTDIQDATYFSLRLLSDNQYPKVEAGMSAFEPSKADDLEKPVKKGTVCAVRYSLDHAWYRARVIRSVGKGQFEVEFLDFGNVDTVHWDDMKRLSQSLLQIDPQSKGAQLAFIKTLKTGNEVGDEAAKNVQDFALDNTVDAIVVGEERGLLQVVLFAKGEKNWSKSLNCQLLEKGLAMMKKYDEDDDTLP